MGDILRNKGFLENHYIEKRRGPRLCFNEYRYAICSGAFLSYSWLPKLLWRRIVSFFTEIIEACAMG